MDTGRGHGGLDGIGARSVVIICPTTSTSVLSAASWLAIGVGIIDWHGRRGGGGICTCQPGAEVQPTVSCMWAFCCRTPLRRIFSAGLDVLGSAAYQSMAGTIGSMTASLSGGG